MGSTARPVASEGVRGICGRPVICRLRLGDLKVDFMPDDESILGVSNRWYAKGIETAVTCHLNERLNIKRLTPELFVATKLEAYLGRGNDNLLGSRDIEDILLVVDGREELVAEIQTQTMMFAATLQRSSKGS